MPARPPRPPRRPGGPDPGAPGPGPFRRSADGSWPPPSRPIAVEGGLRARSRRGAIGATWWSRRFISLLESFGLGGRLQRGRRYARTGQVRSMEIVSGQVSASVQGSRPRPYRVHIETEVLGPSVWDTVEDAMAARAVFAARLLAGEMPEEIEEAFAEASTTLFPASADELDAACSCPDWENPCKHIAAVYYLLAEAFDDDPFWIFAWRGRTKEQLLAGLRSRRRPSPSTGEPRLEALAAPAESGPFGWPAPGPAEGARPPRAVSFWGSDDDLAAVEVRPRLAVAPDLVLRQLDPAPLGDHGPAILSGLAPLYEAIVRAAASEALGEEPG